MSKLPTVDQILDWIDATNTENNHFETIYFRDPNVSDVMAYFIFLARLGLYTRMKELFENTPAGEVLKQAVIETYEYCENTYHKETF